MSGRIMTLSAATVWSLVPLAAEAQSGASGLPEGAGKELVESVCTACHQTNQITRSSGYTREGWRELTSTMVDLSADTELPPELEAGARRALLDCPVHAIIERLPSRR